MANNGNAAGASMKANGHRHTKIWGDRKRILFFALPLTFTTYNLYDDELVVKRGILRQSFEKVKCFRIVDTTVTRSFMQRIFGLSDILIDARDESTHGKLVLKNVPHGFEVDGYINDAVEEARKNYGVATREYMGGGYDDFGDVDDSMF